MGCDMCYWVELWLWLAFVSLCHDLLRSKKPPPPQTRWHIHHAVSLPSHTEQHTGAGQGRRTKKRVNVTRPWSFRTYKCHSRTHKLYIKRIVCSHTYLSVLGHWLSINFFSLMHKEILCYSIIQWCKKKEKYNVCDYLTLRKEQKVC